MKDNQLEEQERRQKKMDLLNSKISLILPELMSRNTKLGERLKNKLKVSNLFNNIEHRNKKYLKGFILSSNKRANDLKTGLEMNKAIKQSNKNILLLCKQMKNDLILKNSDALLKEKKLLNENTEQETHLKINDFIHTIKNAIKPPNSLRTTHFQEKINNYIDKMRSSLDNENYEKDKIKIRKDFNKYIENMYIEDDIKFINYTKPKQQQIKDKESANLIRIKKYLYPNIFDKIKLKKENKSSSQIVKNLTPLRKNASLNNINNNKYHHFSEKENKTFEEVEVNGKDTIEVLNNLVNQGQFLSERMEQKLEKINSLIDVKLPYTRNYELVLNYIKNQGLRNDEKLLFSPKSEERYEERINRINSYRNLMKISPYIRRKLSLIKEDISHLRPEYINITKKNNFRKVHISHLSSQNSFNKDNKIKFDKTTIDKSHFSIKNSPNNSFINQEEKLFITSKK